MSVFNRVVVVVIAVVILAGAVITLFVATGVSTPNLLPYGWFESQLQRVADAIGGSLAAKEVVDVQCCRNGVILACPMSFLSVSDSTAL